MASKNFVIRQGTLQFTEITPGFSEFLAVNPDGLVTTTSIATGNFDNYTLVTTTEQLTGSLQTQIDSLVSASSGAIATINGVTPDSLNIDLVSSSPEVTIGAGPSAGEVAIELDLSSYATISLVSSISGSLAGDIVTLQGDISTLQGDVSGLETDVAFLSAAIDAIDQESTVIESSGGSIIVTQDGSTWNVEVASAPIQNHNDLTGLQGGTSGEYYHLTQAQFNDYIGSSEVALISSGLDSRLDVIEGDYVINSQLDSYTLLTTTASISSGLDSRLDTIEGDYLTSADITNFITTSEVAAISSNLQGQITTNANDIIQLENDLAALPAQLDTRFVNLSGDVMTGDLQVPNLEVTGDTTINGNLYVNGTEFIVNVQSVSAADNLIVINAGEVGAGVTAGEAGIEVDRGSLTNYFFLFDESDDSFKIGETGDLQKVATREDSPLPDGIAVWNAAESRFDTVAPSSLASDLSGSFVLKSGDVMTGSLEVQDDITISNNGVLEIGGATQAYAENLDVDPGLETIDSFDATLGVSAQWVVSIRQGTTNARTSTINAVWLNGTVEFSEYSTNDIGNTTEVVMDVVLSGGNVILRADVDTDDWIIKAHRIIL